MLLQIVGHLSKNCHDPTVQLNTLQCIDLGVVKDSFFDITHQLNVLKVHIPRVNTRTKCKGLFKSIYRHIVETEILDYENYLELQMTFWQQ